MRIDVVTIFPSYMDPLRQSLPGKAIESGLVELNVHDLRRWTHDVHRSVDDAPTVAARDGDEGAGLGRSA
ncbi:tRNA (Guanine-1)-methyltransferase family protein [Mycobacterium xenopi 3993]|nr:tRNA (Guanine-1)-methyltransferase family protein [Mycobacterium xenopi 3993]